MNRIGEGFILLPVFIGMTQDKIDLCVAFSIDDCGCFAMPLRVAVNIDQFGHFLIGSQRRFNGDPGIFIGKVPVVIRHFCRIILLRMHRTNPAFF
ncbi:hypothetical protein D3C80_1641890 [compost metagenome]